MRKRLSVLLLLFVSVGLLELPFAQPVVADAAGCPLGTYVDLGPPGDSPEDECQISTVITATGTFNFHHSLHILAGGGIDASNDDAAPPTPLVLNINGAPGLDFILDGLILVDNSDDAAANEPNDDAGNATINVTGDMLMQSGSAIRVENRIAGGDGGIITIDVDGNMTMCGTAGVAPGCTAGGSTTTAFNPASCGSGATTVAVGALISATKRAGAGDTGLGGQINITVGDLSTAQGDFIMDGGANETGAWLQADACGDAGDITVTAGRLIDIDPGAVVQSRGGTTNGEGGKIVLEAGCELDQGGRVTSRGQDAGADLVRLIGCEVFITGLVQSISVGHDGNAAPNCTLDADHPLNGGSEFEACVEVWGRNITIDDTGTNNGEVQSATGLGGGENRGQNYIDLFAFVNLTILGDETVPYAVHADGLGGTGGNGEEGGVVTAKAGAGRVLTTGLAIAANATGAGGEGGLVRVLAGGPSAPAGSGDVNFGAASVQARGGTGTGSTGGAISAQSFNEDIEGAVGGSLDAGAATATGSVTLTACGVVNYAPPGTTNPTATKNAGVGCGGVVTFPSYVEFNQDVWEACEGPPDLEIEKTPDEPGDVGGTIDAGDDAVFTIVVSNSGSGDAEGVTLDDVLPTGTGFPGPWVIDSETIPGACSIAVDGVTLHCDIGTLTPSGSFTVVVSTPTTGDICPPENNGTVTILNGEATREDETAGFAEADATNTEPVFDNGAIVVSCPGLEIEKTPDEPGDVGGTITVGTDAVFTIVVTNNGPGEATNVTLNDVLPDPDGSLEWTIVSVTDTGGADASSSCSITGTTDGTGDTLDCSFGDMADDDFFTVVVSATTSEALCELAVEGELELDNPDSTADADNTDEVIDAGAIVMTCPGPGTKSGLKFNDDNGDGELDDGELGIPGWTIHIFGTTTGGDAVHEHPTTDATGAYTIDLEPGVYTACEEQQTGWGQTFPDPGTDSEVCDGHDHTGNPGLEGYTFTVVGDDQHPNNDFGNQECPSGSVTINKTITNGGVEQALPEDVTFTFNVSGPNGFLAEDIDITITAGNTSNSAVVPVSGGAGTYTVEETDNDGETFGFPQPPDPLPSDMTDISSEGESEDVCSGSVDLTNAFAPGEVGIHKTHQFSGGSVIDPTTGQWVFRLRNDDGTFFPCTDTGSPADPGDTTACTTNFDTNGADLLWQSLPADTYVLCEDSFSSWVTEFSNLPSGATPGSPSARCVTFDLAANGDLTGQAAIGVNNVCPQTASQFTKAQKKSRRRRR